MKKYIIHFIVLLGLFISSCEVNNKNVTANETQLPISDTTWTKVVENLNFPEGPAWDVASNSVYLSNCNGGWISRVNGNVHDTFLVASNEPLSFEKTNGMTFHNGYLFACEYGNGEVLKISRDGKIEIFVDNFQGEKFNRPNDLAFDKKGNLYFTDPKSYGKDKPDGRIFRRDAITKEVILLQDSLTFPNGIAFTKDGKNLFVCESAQSRILKFDVQEDGKITNKTEFIVLPGGDPDGIAFDKKGNLYVAHYGTGTLFIINSSGKIIQEIKTPGNKPTNVEFAGKDFRTLFLTEVETNSLYKIDVNIIGQLLN
ncbi:MAG: SMP-30/gluconolactonase/LRE family protein [Melioribacteraceae bacterium]